jgi:hypothetical protein
MTLIALHALADNSIRVYRDEDPTPILERGDTAPMIAALDAPQFTPAAILVTHHLTGVCSAGPTHPEIQ